MAGFCIHATLPKQKPPVPAELAANPRAVVEAILTIPLAGDAEFSAAEIQQELDNNAQGILGYVG